MSKFSDFVKDENNSEVKHIREKVSEENLSKLIDKYSTYSQDDLMEEFVKEGARKKENGELSDENLLKIKNVLTPYLNSEQQQKLNDLLNKVK